MASRVRRYSRTLRVSLERSLPIDPLVGVSGLLHPISVVIPCVAKDFPLLPIVIDSIWNNITNPVDDITILTSKADAHFLPHPLPGKINIMYEEDEQLDLTYQTIERRVNASRQGWVKQQVLKLSFVARSNSKGILVVDSDTVLLRPRIWLRGQFQILNSSHEYHRPYFQHLKRSLGQYSVNEGISWVTHHQLMQPKYVRQMLFRIAERFKDPFPGTNQSNIDRALRFWVSSADFSDPSALSEYQTYGSFIRRICPQEVFPTRWGNKALPPSQGLSLRDLTVNHFENLSISFHSYLKSDL